MDKKEKIKYDSKYIAYVESGESAAVFVARDIAKDLDTRGKWIDIISIDGHKNSDEVWVFKTIKIELFPRKTNPVYPENASEEDKKYITWQAAHKDIDFQRSQGYKGPRFELKVNTVNLNKGKFKMVDKCYNKTFHRYVPLQWNNSSCEIRHVKQTLKPYWKYFVNSVKRIR